VAQYLHSGGKPERFMAILVKLMLRENQDFHVIQSISVSSFIFKQEINPAIRLSASRSRILGAGIDFKNKDIT
jgi:hypothetical protein